MKHVHTVPVTTWFGSPPHCTCQRNDCWCHPRTEPITNEYGESVGSLYIHHDIMLRPDNQPRMAARPR